MLPRSGHFLIRVIQFLVLRCDRNPDAEGAVAVARALPPGRRLRSQIPPRPDHL